MARHYYRYTRTTKCKNQILPTVGDDVGKKSNSCAKCIYYILVNHFRKIFESLLKLNICVLNDSAIPLRVYIHQKHKVIFTKNRNKINKQQAKNHGKNTDGTVHDIQTGSYPNADRQQNA